MRGYILVREYYKERPLNVRLVDITGK